MATKKTDIVKRGNQDRELQKGIENRKGFQDQCDEGTESGWREHTSASYIRIFTDRSGSTSWRQST